MFYFWQAAFWLPQLSLLKPSENHFHLFSHHSPRSFMPLRRFPRVKSMAASRLPRTEISGWTPVIATSCSAFQRRARNLRKFRPFPEVCSETLQTEHGCWPISTPLPLLNGKTVISNPAFKDAGVTCFVHGGPPGYLGRCGHSPTPCLKGPCKALSLRSAV